MIELFEQIIIGEKDIEELKKENAKSEKAKRTTEVAAYFLKTANKNYNDKKITRKNVKKIINIYEGLLKDNKTINDYLNSKEDNIKDVEHIIKLYVDDFIKETNKESIWTRELPIKGYVEVILLSLITLFAGISVIGQIYLKLY